LCRAEHQDNSQWVVRAHGSITKRLRGGRDCAHFYQRYIPATATTLNCLTIIAVKLTRPDQPEIEARPVSMASDKTGRVRSRRWPVTVPDLTGPSNVIHAGTLGEQSNETARTWRKGDLAAIRGTI